MHARAALLLRHALAAGRSGRSTPRRCAGDVGGGRARVVLARVGGRRAATTTAPLLPPPGRPAGPPSAALRLLPSRRPALAAPSSSTADGAAAAPCTPTNHTPLCERPPAFQTSLAAVGEWVAWARKQVAELGPAGLSADGGPGLDELQTELRWLLEDAVAGPSTPGGDPPPHPPPPGTPPAWSALAPDACRPAPAAADPATVWLRASLPDLTARWGARLSARVPFQYTVGCAHWRDLVLAVGPGVLCPRPETEQLVDLALAAAVGDPRRLADGGGAWADLCTGSGAVALGLAAAFRGSADLTPPAVIWAADVCPVAAGWAEANVARLLGGRDAPPPAVRVVQGDLLAALPPGTPPLAGILSNPPYIPRGQMAGLQPEVGAHEPALALDGGPGPGLDVLSRLVAGAPAALAPGGFVGLETAGHGQAERVAELLTAQQAFVSVAVHDDAFGVARFVTARRRED